MLARARAMLTTTAEGARGRPVPEEGADRDDTVELMKAAYGTGGSVTRSAQQLDAIWRVMKPGDVVVSRALGPPVTAGIVDGPAFNTADVEPCLARRPVTWLTHDKSAIPRARLTPDTDAELKRPHTTGYDLEPAAAREPLSLAPTVPASALPTSDLRATFLRLVEDIEHDGAQRHGLHVERTTTTPVCSRTARTAVLVRGGGTRASYRVCRT